MKKTVIQVSLIMVMAPMFSPSTNANAGTTNGNTPILSVASIAKNTGYTEKTIQDCLDSLSVKNERISSWTRATKSIVLAFSKWSFSKKLSHPEAQPVDVTETQMAPVVDAIFNYFYRIGLINSVNFEKVKVEIARTTNLKLTDIQSVYDKAMLVSDDISSKVPFCATDAEKLAGRRKVNSNSMAIVS